MARVELIEVAEKKLREAARNYVFRHCATDEISRLTLYGQLQFAARIARQTGIPKEEIDRIILEEFFRTESPS